MISFFVDSVGKQLNRNILLTPHMKAHLSDANSVYLKAARHEALIVVLYFLTGGLVCWASWAMGDRGFWSLISMFGLHAMVSFTLAEDTIWRRVGWALWILIIETLALTIFTLGLAILNALGMTYQNPFPFSMEHGAQVDWKMIWENCLPLGTMVLGIVAQIHFIHSDAPKSSMEETPPL
ncbi:hypothetical protein EB052_02265 [bacterium]|nr:hypothetical protein [bacterium]